VARTGRQATAGDMIRSLAVLIVPLLVIAFLFTRTPRHPPVHVVSWQPVLRTARAQSPYPVLAPVDLPSTWWPTRVTWVKLGEPYLNSQPAVRNTWELGFLDPDHSYVGLVQGDLHAAELISDTTRGGVPDGRSGIDGRTWQRLVSPDDRTRALVLTTPGATAVVSGDVDYPVLEAFASTLRAN
jgi:hypothetical protein